jgi:lysine 2,3-aminomutase
MKSDWMREMKERIVSLPKGKDQNVATRLGKTGSLPFAAPLPWLALAKEDYRACSRDSRGIPLDPILAQTLPSALEFSSAASETPDPLGEALHSVASRIVHQYGSRLLVRATGECPMFCRHCFRRSLLSSERGFIDAASIDFLKGYLAAHSEVREVLVSGGDPLTATNSRLRSLFGAIRSVRPDVVIRLCTRAPVTLPSRIESGLTELLEETMPLKVVVQVNHPAELSEGFLEAVKRLRASTLGLRSQTVLLRGINDSVEILESLFTSLSILGVDPYYLFQGDLATGTAHFRVPLSRGLQIYGELRRRLSGMELPRYAVDAPDGGGKLYLPECVVGLKEGNWLLKAPDGSLHRYPEETGYPGGA